MTRTAELIGAVVLSEVGWFLEPCQRYQRSVDWRQKLHDR